MSDGGAQHITFGPFFDSAGVLLPSIKIYHYAAGTTNDANMWSDENKATPVAQPFIGDTSGVARLFGDNIYKIVIHDENDNLIEDYTWDNVHISRDVEGVVRNGTSFPSVIPNNTWQMAVKKDGSGKFSELGVSDGTSFIVLVKMNAAGDTHIFDNILASGAITTAHAHTSKSADYTILDTDEIIDITTAGETPPGACTGALAGVGAGSVDDGTHSYKITFVDAEGETEGGAVSNVVTVADKSTDGRISLTSIPTGSGSVTSRKIYRTIAGDAGNYKLVATLADNVTTIYTDNTADAGLGADIPIVPPSRVTITVPSDIITETGRRFILRKVDTDPGAYDIVTEGAETINGVASFKNWRAYERVVIESDGTNLFVTADGTLDEDDLRSNSATHRATQQSVKAYIDASLNQEIFTSSGTFTVPTGVTEVLITAVAGGGGGGGGAVNPATTAGNGGGAGQAIIDYSVTGLTPSADITVTVGDGGAGGGSASDGIDGGDTVFTGHITVNGGGKGIRGLGGAGGSTAIGTAAGVGGSGGSGAADGTAGGDGLFGAGGVGGTDSGGSPGGGGGGGSIYGAGGAGGNATAGAGGAADTNSGAGGGGGSGAGGGAGGVGAAGGSGRLIVRW